MRISEVLYHDKRVRELAELIEEQSHVKVRYYKPANPNIARLYGRSRQNLPPGSLFLGTNDSHDRATFLSNYPIVVIDRHSDMFDTLYRYLEIITFTNWVYWRLKLVGDVHLVVPDPNEFEPGDFIIPKKGVDRFNLYSLKASKSLQDCVTDGQKGSMSPNCTKKIKPLEELSQLEGKSIQLSIDLDFFSEDFLPENEMRRISDSIPEPCVYDIWIDLKQRPELQYKCILDFLEKIQD